MSTIVASHQPNYLPYLGFFDKIKKADIFVVCDDCQFTDRDWHHRNKIRIYEGWKWLTVPVSKKKVPIKDKIIRNEVPIEGEFWSKNHYREIEANYRKTPYFESYSNDLKKIYSRKFEKLIDLNMAIISFLLKSFEIDVEIKYSSELGITSRKTQRVLDIVNAVEGDLYISGLGSKKYLDQKLIKNFNLRFNDFKHPVYPQIYPGFEPNMATIDALFNIGKLG